MAMFHPAATAVLTSTTGSQTVTVPTGFGTLLVYNAAANPVYLKFAASVAVPTTFASGEQVMAIPPTSSRSFDVPSAAGGTLAYIAATAGGALVLTLGEGKL